MHFLSGGGGGGASSSTGGGGEGNNVVEDALAAWEAVDFGGSLQLSLEDQATQLVDMQENRLNQRKDLAQKTKEFRARPEDAEHANELVKLYQKSLEDVTAQAKFSANAFLTLFKILRDLPDPVDALAWTLDEAVQLKARIKTLEDREESLANALKASREKARGADELRAEREKFRENVQLDGDAKLEAERVAAQEKLVQAQAHFDEELAKLQSQLDIALDEIERLKASEVLVAGRSLEEPRARVDSRDLQSARSEGYAEAERVFAIRLEESSRMARESASQFQSQLDELQATISAQMEQISKLRTELSNRPDPSAVEKLKAQLEVMTQLTSGNPQVNELRRSSEKLDGLEAWLLNTNQRLVEEANALKAELAQLKEMVAQTKSDLPARERTPLSLPPADVGGDDAQTTGALRAQRDRLRGVLEKRDLEIERMQNSMEEKDQKLRRVEDEAEKLRQRVRFLQSYKVSEKSTLLPANADPEAGATAMLGRGVGHEFRNLWEAGSAAKGGNVFAGLRNALANRRRDPKGFVFVIYLGVLHAWFLFVLLSGCRGPVS